MPESDAETQFKDAFIERTKAARVASNKKQWQMAEALGISQDQYKQYEGRGMLPHRFIGRFCIITNIDPVWLLTGHGEKAIKPLRIVSQEPAPSAKPKRRRSRKAA